MSWPHRYIEVLIDNRTFYTDSWTKLRGKRESAKETGGSCLQISNISFCLVVDLLNYEYCDFTWTLLTTLLFFSWDEGNGGERRFCGRHNDEDVSKPSRKHLGPRHRSWHSKCLPMRRLQLLRWGLNKMSLFKIVPTSCDDDVSTCVKVWHKYTARAQIRNRTQHGYRRQVLLSTYTAQWSEPFQRAFTQVHKTERIPESNDLIITAGAVQRCL